MSKCPGQQYLFKVIFLMVVNLSVANGAKPSMEECVGAALGGDAPRTASAGEVRLNIWSQVQLGQHGAMRSLIEAGVIEGGSIRAVNGADKNRVLAELSTQGVMVSSVVPGIHKDLKGARIRAESAGSDTGSGGRGYLQIGKHLYEVRVPARVHDAFARTAATAVPPIVTATPVTSHYRSVPTTDQASVPRASTARPVEGVHALMRRLLVESGKMTEEQFSKIDPRSFDMIEVSPGTFMMGSPKNEPGRYDDETQHLVTIARP